VTWRTLAPAPLATLQALQPGSARLVVPSCNPSGSHRDSSHALRRWCAFAPTMVTPNVAAKET